MSYENTGVATEALFDAEQTAESLLDAIRTNVNANVNSIDAAAALENKLSEQAASFNQCLTTMANAYRKCEAGEITREQAMDECKPCVDALKSHCEALNLSGVSVGSGDITEEEIAMLREVIVGAKDIVAARKHELEDCPITSVSQEGFMSTLNNMEPATEALSADKILKNSNEKRSADELYKNAKKLYGLGQKDKAVEYMGKAKKLYEKLIDTAKKNGKYYSVERTVTNASVSDKFKKQVTQNKDIEMLVAYLEDRVDSCQAWLMKWNDKDGAGDYKALKASLKSDRKAARKERNANRLAAIKAMPKNAIDRVTSIPGSIKAKFSKDPDGAVMEGLMFLSYMDACESFLDDCELDLAMEAAMEGEGADGETEGKAGLGSRLRAAFSRLRKAKNEDNESEMKSANAEIQQICNSVESADSQASEDGEKKGMSTVAKVGLGAAAAAAIATLGVTMLGQSAMKKANGNINDVKGAMQTVAKISNSIVNAPKAMKASHQQIKAYDAGFKEQVKNVQEGKKNTLQDLNAQLKAITGNDAAAKQQREDLKARIANVKKGASDSIGMIKQAKKDNRGNVVKGIRQHHARYAANAQNDYGAGVNYARYGAEAPAKKKANEGWDMSELLAAMAIESDLGDIMEEETKVQPQVGKGFDDDDIQGNHMIEQAEEGCDGEDCEDLATESFIDAMAAEDGFLDD